jgi:hypothetical protein
MMPAVVLGPFLEKEEKRGENNEGEFIVYGKGRQKLAGKKVIKR